MFLHLYIITHKHAYIVVMNYGVESLPKVSTGCMQELGGPMLILSLCRELTERFVAEPVSL